MTARGLRRRAIQWPVLLLVFLFATACVEWRVEPVPGPSSRAASRLPARVRVETQSGQSMVLWYPELRGDTIVGRLNGTDHPGSVTEMRIAIADVRHLEARRPSFARSAVAAVGITVAALGLLVLALGGSNS